MKMHKLYIQKVHHDGRQYFKATCGNELTLHSRADCPRWEELGFSGRWAIVTCSDCLGQSAWKLVPENRRKEAVMATRKKRG